MNLTPKLLAALLAGLILAGCQPKADHDAGHDAAGGDEFTYQTEQFADLKILRYQVPGFDELSLQQKTLVYYLYEASLAGRDIMYDQNFKHNLSIRRTLEAIINTGQPQEKGEEWDKFMEYTKRVWFSNGIHHHYSNDKLMPEFSQAYFADLVAETAKGDLPLMEGESAEQLTARLTPIMFDPAIAPKKVNLNSEVDIIANSAINFYEGVTQEEVQTFYDNMKTADDSEPISYGLNSKLMKENGQVVEKVWKVGGMYTQAMKEMVKWLEKAATVAENDQQAIVIKKLVEYYQTGDLKTFDDYSVAWVNDTASVIDLIHGFIEVYNDPMGYRGSYEAVVQIKDPEATKRIAAIGKEAQWFEDNSPIMDTHKKANVKGITARVINVAIESGDASPSTPIGINLPNANWIRATHGSKSVSLANIVSAYDEASKNSGGSLKEFAYSQEEMDRVTKYGHLADLLHTDMHEVIGHASGQIEEGVGTPKETLKSYSSTLEEGRADLVALYYLMDQKLVDMGLLPSLEAGMASYDDYIRNGCMTQLKRIKVGDDIEEAHMRNRAWVSWWAFDKGQEENVIERVRKDGKTYFVIRDYDKLRGLFGQLLQEVQRIKSQGDYEAAKALVEGYGVKVDQDLHAEVLERYSKLNIAPYGGFINPIMTPVIEGGEITDIKMEIPMDFTEQMLYYAKNYSFLPHYN